VKAYTVEFEQVRDCPLWCDGECLHDVGPLLCNTYECSEPPTSCPLPDVKEGGI